MPQPLAGRVIDRESPRDTLQLVARDLSECAAESSGADETLQRRLVGHDVLPHQVQLGRAGHVHAAADPHVLGSHFEVESGTPGLG